MAFRNRIPWNRDRNARVGRRCEDEARVVAQHRGQRSLFDDLFQNPDQLISFGSSCDASFEWPKIELSEDEKAIKIVVNMSGVGPKDIDVSVHHDMLTIRGKKRGAWGGAMHSEQWLDACQRLSPDADREKITVDFRDGVLTVSMAKRREAQKAVRSHCGSNRIDRF